MGLVANKPTPDAVPNCLKKSRLLLFIFNFKILEVPYPFFQDNLLMRLYVVCTFSFTLISLGLFFFLCFCYFLKGS